MKFKVGDIVIYKGCTKKVFQTLGAWDRSGQPGFYIDDPASLLGYGLLRIQTYDGGVTGWGEEVELVNKRKSHLPTWL